MGLREPEKTWDQRQAEMDDLIKKWKAELRNPEYLEQLEDRVRESRHLSDQDLLNLIRPLE